MRPKSTHRDLPPRMLRRVRTMKSGKVWESYFYNGRDASGRRIEIPLGHDLNEAKRKWAELECQDRPPETGLMRYIFDRYEREILPTKAVSTQRENLGCLGKLRKVFDGAPIDAITPQFIAQYRDKRGAVAPVRANREITLFSHVFNMAREWGYTARENPVKGVRKNKETPRDFYADAAVWDAVYGAACVELRDAMDLNYLTGQRPADVLKMRYSDIRDGALEVKPNKTQKSSGKKLRILLDDPDTGRTMLGQLIDRIRARARDTKLTSMCIVATPAGAALNQWTLRTRFDDARDTAAKAAEKAGDMALAKRIREFQFRDIRPKAASETDLAHASKLLGHTDKQITKTVYQRVGETVLPTK
ncbi:integrase [Aquitalea palustris]|uniref:Integrase n=2 Tax=Aquitalea palustris TaxID=2480983 RepID=A0A454JKS6_9NEIS|nr:integrase [Aquitalea palustris]